MIPFPFKTGMPFREMICKEKDQMDRLIIFLSRNGLDPFKAATKINTAVGRTICEVHAGNLVEYEDIGSPKHINVNGIHKFALVEIVVVRVKYADGYEGYTWRTQTEVRPNRTR